MKGKTTCCFLPRKYSMVALEEGILDTILIQQDITNSLVVLVLLGRDSIYTLNFIPNKLEC